MIRTCEKGPVSDGAFLLGFGALCAQSRNMLRFGAVADTAMLIALVLVDVSVSLPTRCVVRFRRGRPPRGRHT